MFGKIKSNPSCQFYSLTKDEIKNNESKLGIIFPKLLREFYLEIGYGFIGSEVGNINRIMDPESVLDFRLRQNDFEIYPDIEIYDEFEEDKMDWKSSLQDGISETIPLQLGIRLKSNVEFLIFNFLNRVYFSFL